MKVQRLITIANKFVVDENYITLIEQFPVAAERADQTTAYDGVSEVTKDNLEQFIVYMNTFWANLPDTPQVSSMPGYITLCVFNDIWLPELEDYDEVYNV